MEPHPMNQVLIVEPDAAVGMAFLRAFIGAGFDAQHLSSVPRAIAALNLSRPNAVVFNSLIQNDHVRSLLQTIQSHSGDQPLPVISFTQSGAASVVQGPRFQGVTKFVTLGTNEAEDLLHEVEWILKVPKESAGSEQQEVPKSPDGSSVKNTGTSVHGNVVEAGKPLDLQQAKSISQSLLGAKNRMVRQSLLTELYQCFQSFTENTPGTYAKFIATLGETLTAFVTQLCPDPTTSSPTTFRTLLQAVNALDVLLKQPSSTQSTVDPVFNTLAVDDESEILEMVQDSLRIARLRSDGAETASKALQLAEKHRYDLIVLDIMMPDIDGFELCKKFRISRGYEQTPIIFLTGSDQFDSRIRSASSGGTDFISKPFLAKELALKALVHLAPRWSQLSSK